jgi:hypothetical protein
MFGGAGTSAAGGAASGAAPAAAGLIDIGGATVNAATGLAPAAATTSIGSIAAQLATNPQSLGALSQLAMVMFNKDMTELTDEEKAQLKEIAAQASTNRALFEQRVEEARRVIQAGSPNPEQAYANARFGAENQLAEQRRAMPVGLQEAAERKGAIESSKVGSHNVALDYARAMDTRQAGLSMMPDEAPKGYNQLAMPTYSDLYARRNDYDEQISKGIGSLFGSFA